MVEIGVSFQIDGFKAKLDFQIANDSFRSSNSSFDSSLRFQLGEGFKSELWVEIRFSAEKNEACNVNSVRFE